jgi:hypothetical protein
MEIYSVRFLGRAIEALDDQPSLPAAHGNFHVSPPLTLVDLHCLLAPRRAARGHPNAWRYLSDTEKLIFD